MYQINASIPKTMVLAALRLIAKEAEEPARTVLAGIASAPITPELLPGAAANDSEARAPSMGSAAKMGQRAPPRQNENCWGSVTRPSQRLLGVQTLDALCTAAWAFGCGTASLCVSRAFPSTRRLVDSANRHLGE